jgi:hypothetical protein
MTEMPAVMSRDSSTQQGYGSAWRKLRKRVLLEEPNCRRCGEPSTDVDHMIPRRRAAARPANLRALPRHSKYAAETDGASATR